MLKFKWSFDLFTPEANAKPICDAAARQGKSKVASNVTILIYFAFDCAKCEGKKTFRCRSSEDEKESEASPHSRLFSFSLGMCNGRFGINSVCTEPKASFTANEEDGEGENVNGDKCVLVLVILIANNKDIFLWKSVNVNGPLEANT